MMSVCVDPARIGDVWPHFKEWVRRAINKGFADFDIVERGVLDGKSLLWLAYDGQEVHAVALTDLVGGSCEITACAGHHLKQFLPLLKDLEQFARDEKCKSIRLCGRKGWTKFLKDYRAKQIVLEKAL